MGTPSPPGQFPPPPLTTGPTSGPCGCRPSVRPRPSPAAAPPLRSRGCTAPPSAVVAAAPGGTENISPVYGGRCPSRSEIRTGPPATDPCTAAAAAPPAPDPPPAAAPPARPPASVPGAPAPVATPPPPEGTSVLLPAPPGAVTPPCVRVAAPPSAPPALPAAPPAAAAPPSVPSAAAGDVAIIVAPPRGGAAARFGALVVASGVSTARLFRDGIAPAADPAGNARFETSLKREEGRREGSGASLQCGQP